MDATRVFWKKSQAKKKRTRQPVNSAVFNPTWARFPSEKSWASTRPFEEGTVNKAPAKRGKKRGETTPKAFLPSTGRDDKVSRTIFRKLWCWETQFVAVRAVSSYQWTTPRSRCTFEHESMPEVGKHSATKAGRRTLHSWGTEQQFQETSRQKKCCLRRTAYIA